MDLSLVKLIGGVAILGAWAYLGLEFWQRGHVIPAVAIAVSSLIALAIGIHQLRRH